MFDIPSESKISEMMKNYIRDSAEDELDREMIAMLDAEDAAAAQSSQRRRGLSHRKYIDRERESEHDHMIRDYFSDDLIFGTNLFRRRFQMRRNLFIRIVEDLSNHSSYFTIRPYATGRRGLSALQRCTATIRQLAYATPGDSLDEYMRMGESTTLEALHKFCSAVVEVYHSQYLRRRNDADTQRFMKKGMAFPECWGVLIVCIGNGGVVPSLGKANMHEEITVSWQLCLKRSICRFVDCLFLCSWSQQ